ncbi:MAG: hypothetical protein MI976_10605 [Pseudomonadales bacterium]|nr:hypothetical protein [Pseudomonadales bacterium]
MRILSVLIVVFGLAACQMPSEEVISGDNSAGLSFKVVNVDDANAYEVFVDGLAMGKAKDFLAGKTILKVLPGSHVIRVERNGEVVLEEKHYVAAGANKVLVVR